MDEYIQASNDWLLPLTAGEDYQLCFTVDPDKVASIPIECTQVGEIEAEQGLRIQRSGQISQLEDKGFEHFLNSGYGKNKLSVTDIMRNPVLFLAFGFGSGLSRLMPGTMGTLAAIPVYLLFIQTNFWLYSVLTLLVMVAGVWICDAAAKKLGVHDFGGIVWDEIAGFLITMWWVPFSWYAVFLGFVFLECLTFSSPGLLTG